MNNWYEVKVKYEKVDLESGVEKKVTEAYLVDAVSFTEAESRIHSELEEVIKGDFLVTNISKANYSDIVDSENDNADKWYKCKVSYISIDEEAGKERKITTTILVLAFDIQNAYDNLVESFSGMTVDYVVVGINESPLVDIFPYFKSHDN